MVGAEIVISLNNILEITYITYHTYYNLSLLIITANTFWRFSVSKIWIRRNYEDIVRYYDWRIIWMSQYCHIPGCFDAGNIFDLYDRGCILVGTGWKLIYILAPPIFWKVLENQYQIQGCFDARIIFDLYDRGCILDGTWWKRGFYFSSAHFLEGSGKSISNPGVLWCKGHFRSLWPGA